MTLLMEGRELIGGPELRGGAALAGGSTVVGGTALAEEDEAARADALLAEAFGFTITHRGREAEVVMADVTLCCSTCCSCSSKQQPR
jgi:hypothetical protein